MNKSVLISIRPTWCGAIASGRKTIEVRKTRPKIDTPFKCYIYCTKTGSQIYAGGEKANGKAVGEFTCDFINKYESEFYDDNSVLNAVWLVVPDEDDPNYSYSYQIMSNEGEKQGRFEKTICMNLDTLKGYIGTDKTDKIFYGWHISDLVIYDKPKELNEFFRTNIMRSDCGTMQAFRNRLQNPPQSWCYVEELK